MSARFRSFGISFLLLGIFSLVSQGSLPPGNTTGGGHEPGGGHPGGGHPGGGHPNPVEQSKRALVNANNNFGFTLFNRVTVETKKGNKFLSPISAHLALDMTLNGATRDTGREMEEALVLRGITRDNLNRGAKQLMAELNANTSFTLEIANSVWVREGIPVKAQFQDGLGYYGAVATPLEFDLPSAPSIINGWVSEKTHGKFQASWTRLFPPIRSFI